MIAEIKEILEYISSRTVDDILLPDYFERIEDYITNLQEENEELKEVNENLLRYVSELILYIDDYKLRCEKASEVLLNIDDDLIYSRKYNVFEDIDYAINILQNGSDEE